MRFKQAKNSDQLIVEFIERKFRREGEPGKDDKKSFQVFSTRINGKTIATIKAPPEPGSKGPYRSARYSFAWYVIEANHKLFIRFLSNEETALDVKAGEIKGEVTKLEFGGNDVILTDNSFKLHRWIEGSDIQKMFSDPVSVDLIKEVGPFLRVDSNQD